MDTHQATLSHPKPHYATSSLIAAWLAESGPIEMTLGAIDEKENFGKPNFGRK